MFLKLLCNINSLCPFMPGYFHRLFLILKRNPGYRQVCFFFFCRIKAKNNSSKITCYNHRVFSLSELSLYKKNYHPLLSAYYKLDTIDRTVDICLILFSKESYKVYASLTPFSVMETEAQVTETACSDTDWDLHSGQPASLCLFLSALWMKSLGVFSWTPNDVSWVSLLSQCPFPLCISPHSLNISLLI